MSDQDYSEFTQEAPTNEAFAALHAAVAEARSLDKKIEEQTQALEQLQSQYNGVIYGKIPTLMAEMRLQKFTTEDGLDINLKEEVNAHISEANKPEAFRWLLANEHGGIIKREVSVAFAKGQEAKAAELIALLGPLYPNLTDDQSVHVSTLKAWVTEMLKKGLPFPLDKFGVRQQKVAKFPKKKAAG